FLGDVIAYNQMYIDLVFYFHQFLPLNLML
ncbi:DUF3267 domain-containing protein, partial [Staphylococcus aureus]